MDNIIIIIQKNSKIRNKKLKKRKENKKIVYKNKLN